MNKKVLYIIAGETCAGKDTVTKLLCERFNTSMIISYTNRRMRSTDIQGVNHHFLSKSEFSKLVQEHNVLAYTKTGDNEYCALEEQLDGAMFYILNPDGVHWFKNYGCSERVEIVTFYITLPLEERRKRASTRNDSLDVFNKRVHDEEEDFSKFALNKEFDYAITNWSSVQTADIIESIIRYLENKRELENNVDN